MRYTLIPIRKCIPDPANVYSPRRVCVLDRYDIKSHGTRVLYVITADIIPGSITNRSLLERRYSLLRVSCRVSLPILDLGKYQGPAIITDEIDLTLSAIVKVAMQYTQTLILQVDRRKSLIYTPLAPSILHIPPLDEMCDECSPVNRTRPIFLDGRNMGLGSVSLVPRKSIFRIPGVHLFHEAVSRHLG